MRTLKNTKLTANQIEIVEMLDAGKTIGEYPTGENGYETMYRWDHSMTTVPSKTVWSLRRKGIEVPTPMKTVNVSARRSY